MLFEFLLLVEKVVFLQGFKDLFDDAYIPGFVVSLFDEVHLLLSRIAVEDVIDLVEGDETVLL